MKEVLTKRFWQNVKKTFDDALEGPPVKANDPGIPAEVRPDNVLSPEASTPPIADIEEAPAPGTGDASQAGSHLQMRTP
jgi:hypothetical protein